MIDEVLLETDSKMQKTVEAVERELAIIRTGRAMSALVEYIKVDYHGVPTPLNQLASISVPEARLLLIQPWDRTSVSSIEKAILKSDLGLRPVSDASLIRIAIPPLSEQRRKELIKIVRKRLEDGRIALRNLRRQSIQKLREMEKNKQLSQDQLSIAEEQLQKISGGFIERVDKLGQDKETEIEEF